MRVNCVQKGMSHYSYIYLDGVPGLTKKGVTKSYYPASPIFLVPSNGVSVRRQSGPSLCACVHCVKSFYSIKEKRTGIKPRLWRLVSTPGV